jgi:hypothetical protein
MRRRARTVLCGGRSVMVVPTATIIRRDLPEGDFGASVAAFRWLSPMQPSSTPAIYGEESPERCNPGHQVDCSECPTISEIPL